jgi:hypothetical protein
MAAVQELYQVANAREQVGVVSTPQAVALRAMGQSGQGSAEVLWRLARERPCAGQAGPLATEATSDALTAAARGPRTGVHCRR